jgi:TolB protein
VVISGLGFARYTVTLEPDESYTYHPQSPRWTRLIDRNLCWSGVYVVRDSRYKACKTEQVETDMKVLLQVTRNSENKRVLRMVVADMLGNPLFPQDLELRNEQFREEELMGLVNRMTEQLTGTMGVLGSTVAFSIKQPGRRKIIARVNTHGQKLLGVSRNQFISLFPRWSPDGKEMLYTTLGRQGTAVWLDRLNEEPPVPVLSGRPGSGLGVTSGGTWFSDKKRIILTLSRNQNVDLYEMDLQTRRLRQITEHPSIDTLPFLAPDNERLVFVSDRSGREQIYYYELSTGVTFQLTFSGSSNSDPAWSPDGTLIAFTKVIGGQSQVYLMDPFTGDQHALTKGGYNSEQPTWSPDGKQLVYAANPSGVYKLYVMFIDGTGMRRLTRTPRDFEETGPNWTLRNF